MVDPAKFTLCAAVQPAFTATSLAAPDSILGHEGMAQAAS